MGDRSAIEWTDASWNPVSGCTKVSQGCKHCYAKRLWPRVYDDRPFEDVRVHIERLDQPRRWKRPRRVFVNSMSDLFHVDVPFWFLDRVFEVMAETPRHTYQVLTKRPERALGYIQWSRWTTAGRGPLENVWIGVSIEDQTTADERVPALLQLPATIRFLSVEPMLGPVDLCCHGCGTSTDVHSLECSSRQRTPLAGIDWVICGGESGPRARPMSPTWARALRDQCVSARVPFFFKQWGEWAAVGQVPLDRNLQDVHALRALVAGSYVAKYGKRVAGRQLDGRVWDEIPARQEVV